MTAVSLSEDLLRESFGVGQLFSEHTSKINAMDFHRGGELLVTSGEDESVNLYQVLEPTWKKSFYFKSSGVQRVRFTNSQWTILCANRAKEAQIFLHSLYDNRILYEFSGHSERISSLEMSPIDDQFISAASDNTIRVWDLRSNPASCIAQIDTASQCTLAYEPSGIIFGALCSPNIVKLFDARSLEQPFASFGIAPFENSSSSMDWSNLQFSPDGTKILACSRSSYSVVLDSFNGTHVAQITGYPNKHRSIIEGSFSNDGKYVVIGSEKGSVYCYESECTTKVDDQVESAHSIRPAKEIAEWKGAHSNICRIVRWNPKKVQVASSCSRLALWKTKPEIPSS